MQGGDLIPCVFMDLCLGPRPDSADGFLSPSRSSSRNGEKDWENGSTTSSVTSNTEYTGQCRFSKNVKKSL